MNKTQIKPNLQVQRDTLFFSKKNILKKISAYFQKETMKPVRKFAGSNKNTKEEGHEKLA